jgi:predicted O-methyltransferase YrrM
MDIIDPRIEEYVERWTTPHDAFLAHVDEVTRDELGHPAMLTGPVAGRFLELLTWYGQPKRVLEIGTFSGHSALAMAAALPEGGHIDTCEVDEEHAAVAQRHFDESPFGSRVTLHVGPALESIAALDGEFDFVFIDADKPNNARYFDYAVRLSHPGTVIVVDNVVYGGEVLEPGSSTAASVGPLVDWIAAHDTVDAVAVQTVGVRGYDGIIVAVVGSQGADGN